MTPAELSRLSTLLDQALDLGEAERESWLAALQGDAQALAPTLRKLLSRYAASETADLLERGPGLGPAPGGPQAGDSVGPYRLLQELGAGGMGIVWLAERSDGSLRRRLALKLPHLGWAPGLAERFAREREILSGLEHPHIARLYDAGLDPTGRPYMALEYVEGQPIDLYCRERSLPVAVRLRLLLQVAAAVAFAHGRLVLHRDIKPANILVTPEGQVRLLDFGVAKLMQGDSAAATALTQASGRAMTPDYASPEQIRGQTLGTASDVYSLAVVAYELLTGSKPYRLKRGSAAELEEAIAEQDVQPASQRAEAEADRLALRGDLDAILNRALKKTVAQRYGSVDAFALDIQRHLDGQRVMARPDTLAYRARRLLQRHRLPLSVGAVTVAAFALALGAGATAVVIAALLLGLGAALWQARRAQAQARRAQEQELLARTEARTAEAVQAFLEGIFRANSGDQRDPQRARERTAKQLLDEGVARVQRELDDVPAAKARVLLMLASMYEDMELLARAEDLFANCARLSAQAHGSGSSAHLFALAQRVRALASLDRLDDARNLLADANARRIQAGQPESAGTAALDENAAWYQLRYQDPQGLQAVQRAVTWHEGQPASVDLVRCRILETRFLVDQRRVGEARTAMDRAMAVAAELGDGANSVMPSAHEAAGMVKFLEGDLEGALQSRADAVRMAALTQGPLGMTTLVYSASYTNSLYNMDRVREAARHCTDILSRVENIADGTQRAWIRNNVVFGMLHSLRANGQTELALQLALDGLDGLQDPRQRLFRLWSAAGALVDLGRLEQARGHLAQAAKLLQTEKPQAHEELRRRLARVELELLLAAGDTAQAEQAWVAERQRACLPAQPKPDEWGPCHDWASLALAGGRPAQALAIAEPAIHAASQHPRRAHLRLRESLLRGVAGRAHLGLGAVQAAIAALHEALQLMSQAVDPEISLQVALLHCWLGLACLQDGDTAQAGQALQAALRIRAHHPGLGGPVVVDCQRLSVALGAYPGGARGGGDSDPGRGHRPD